MQLDHTSHSAIEEYRRCPQRFYLHRVLKVEESQHLAGPAGSAFHTMTEDYDNGLQPRGYEAYLQEALTEDVAYTHSRDENYEWWAVHGQLMFERYKEWRNATGWEILAVEEEFRIQPAGLQWPVVGFIDRRFRSQRTGTEIICDIKTGYRLPTQSVQLPIYFVADGIRRMADEPTGDGGSDADGGEQDADGGPVARVYEGTPVAVNYYNARQGDSTGLEWPDWDVEDLVGYVAPVEQKILEEDWTAKPSAKNCRYCPVRAHCSFKKGK